jgi:phage FluMu protein gp41
MDNENRDPFVLSSSSFRMDLLVRQISFTIDFEGYLKIINSLIINKMTMIYNSGTFYK